METISTEELAGIVQHISKSTLEVYLKNYRFNKYRQGENEYLRKHTFRLDGGFLSLLYSMLDIRGKYRDARAIIKRFGDKYEIKTIDWSKDY